MGELTDLHAEALCDGGVGAGTSLRPGRPKIVKLHQKEIWEQVL